MVETKKLKNFPSLYTVVTTPFGTKRDFSIVIMYWRKLLKLRFCKTYNLRKTQRGSNENSKFFLHSQKLTIFKHVNF